MNRALAFATALLCLLTATPAQAAPLGALIPVIVGALKVSALIKLAVTLVATVAISALTKASNKSKANRPAGIVLEQTLTGGTVSRSILVGTYATAGSLACPAMSHGQDGDTPNAFLTHVFTLADYPVDALVGLIVNGEYVEYGGAETEYGVPLQGKYAGKAWIRFYDGRQTAADSYLVSRYGSYVDEVRSWGADRVGRGVAYAILTWKYDQELFKGEPSCRFVLQGARFYDPRADSTVGGSGAQRWGDPTTWAFTENNIVIAYNILRGIVLYDGTRWGGECTFDDLPLANAVAAMNVCDEAAEVAGGGTEPRYRCGYEILVAEHQPAEIIEELIKSCAGEITEVGGIYKMRAGGPALPSVFITDADIIVTRSQDYDPFPPLNTSHNGVFATFPHPDEEWGLHDAPSLVDPAYVAADDGRENFANVTLPAVPYPFQAQRLMRAWLEDDRRWRKHGLSLGPYSFILEPMDTIAWTSAHNGYVDKVFEIADGETALLTLITASSIREVDPSDYDWTEGMQLPDPTAPGNWNLPAAQAVPGFAVEPYAVVDADGVGRRPAIRATWNPDGAVDATALKIEVRLPVIEVYTADVTVSRVVDGETIITQGVLPNEVYEVRARYQVDRPTEWTSWLSVTTADIKISSNEIDGFEQLELDTAAALLAAQAAKEEAEAATAAIIAAGGEIAELTTVVEAQGASITENATAISNTEGELADLTTTVATLNSSVSTNATAISTLELNAASLETVVSSQGASITENASAITTLTNNVATLETVVSAGSPNLLTNGGFEAGLQGWSGSGWTVARSGWGYHAYAGANGSYALSSQKFPVIAGKSYTIAGDWAFFATGGNVYLDMIFYDAGGAVILDGGQSARLPPHDFQNDGSGRDLIKYTQVAPVGAVEAAARFVVEGGVGVTVAAIRQIKVEQGTIATAYSQEATVRQSFLAIDTSLARYALTLDVNGYTTGWEANNNGTTGNFKVRADLFEVSSPGGGARTEYSGGNWRVYDASGVLRVRMGVW